MSNLLYNFKPNYYRELIILSCIKTGKILIKFENRKMYNNIIYQYLLKYYQNCIK